MISVLLVHTPTLGFSAASCVRREGDWESFSGIPKEVSECEPSTFLRNLKKTIHSVDKGLRPELRARNQGGNPSYRLHEETVVHFMLI